MSEENYMPEMLGMNVEEQQGIASAIKSLLREDSKSLRRT